jgi:hypothetical protein
MEVITAKSYFKNNLLILLLFLGIGIGILVVNDLIGSIEIYPDSIFRTIQKVFDKIMLFIGLILTLSVLITILICCIDFFNDTIKYYNKICTSKWRKDLLNLGFTETLGEHTTLHKDRVATLQHFTLKGIYENMPLQIKSAGQYYDMLEISIPLNLEIDKDIERYQKILTRSINIEYAARDTRIWANIHELQNMVHKEQKLVNYLKFEEL